jgi:hypothetical protein
MATRAAAATILSRPLRPAPFGTQRAAVGGFHRGDRRRSSLLYFLHILSFLYLLSSQGDEKVNWPTLPHF